MTYKTLTKNYLASESSAAKQQSNQSIPKLSEIPPVAPIDEEEHTNGRLQHYLMRFDIIAKSFKTEYLPELEKLKSLFASTLAKDSVKEKIALLDTYNDNLNSQFADYLQSELDKQYINEDILIHRWYVQEILPELNDHLAKEAQSFLDKIQEAHKIHSLDEKFEFYTKAAESIADDLWDYLNENPEPPPVLNAHLKFFQEYLEYLLQQGVVGTFEKDIRSLLKEVQNALASKDNAEKLRVVDIFDEVSSKFGSFLNEKVLEYEIFKFGE
ncbi:uncharacterized protein LOC133333584 [Musca vetustissima]|uniref:uncharacterized protein LOC133333584 n=1 Tax=Musca vetustissima TaxID=27455 RepID=UPI002AB63479|nr:uncharacterized protein LOC133333584 [Musca vetustissima]